MSPQIRLRVLGAPAIITAAGPLSSTKPFVFAAALYLGLNRGRPVRRDELAALLWPDADDAKRGERTRWLVRQLKLAGLALEPGVPELLLPAAAVELDVDGLSRASSAADALALVEHGLLAGYDPRISDLFDRWLEERRDALGAELLHALDEWLIIARRNGSWRTVEELARRMLALDESRADASSALGEAMTMQGREHDRAAAAPRRAPALIGRATVIERLTEGLVPSRRSGHRLGIAGPSGIGKSRVLEELIRVAADGGISVAQLRCQRDDAMRPLSLAVDLAAALLQLPGALGASPRSLDVLRGFVGDAPPDDDGESPEARRAAVHAALRDLTGAVTDEAGLLVVVDDAQWAEPGSWPLLAPVMGPRAAAPQCWVVAIRGETRVATSRVFDTIFPEDDAASERDRELLWLTPLAAEEVEQLAVARVAPRTIPTAALEELTRRTAGVPFIAEALADHWLEKGEVSSLPPSVTRLVRGRLSRLPRDAERLLCAIAVLDLHATPAAVEAVARLERDAMIDAVSALETAGIVRAAEGTLWAHALWTEAVMANTPKAAVALYHRSAAEWLEQRLALQPTEARSHWTVAMHWMAAGDHEAARRAIDSEANALVAAGFVGEAAQMLDRAGDMVGESRSALDYWERSAALWFNDLGPQAPDAMIGIRVKYDNVLRALHGEGFEEHHQVEHLAKVAFSRRTTTTDDQVVQAYLPCALSNTASPQHKVRAASRILYRYGRCGLDRETATAVWEAVADIIPTEGFQACELALAAADYHTRVLGDLEKGTMYADRAIDLAMSLDHADLPAKVVSVSHAVACYETAGDVARSLARLRELLRLGETLKVRYVIQSALVPLIGTLLELGQASEARSLIDMHGPSGVSHDKETVYDRAWTIYRVVCALEQGDATRARQALGVPLEDFRGVVGMPRARILSMYAHLALLEHDDVLLERLLPELLACFAGRLPFMDHPALMTAIALERFHGWDAAASFVRRFITDHRQERWTPRAELMRYLEPQVGDNPSHPDRHSPAPDDDAEPGSRDAAVRRGIRHRAAVLP